MKSIGKYELTEEIGAGTMGTIFRARDTVLERPVALKVLRTDLNIDDEVKERFYREARACARLSHPNIIQVYDLGEVDGQIFIALEMLTGADLRKLLAENKLPPLPVKLDLMVQVCDALEYAHRQGLVHRDIKPGNIFLCDDQRVKVLDFGIARVQASNLTMVGSVLGSPNYMAPEQIRGGKCDSRSDVFSAAIVFFEFLTGSHPFQDDFIPRRIVSGEPESLRRKDPSVPEAVEAALMQALEKDPAKRIQTAEELGSRLRAALKALGNYTMPGATPVPAAVPSPGSSTSQPALFHDTAEQRVSDFLKAVGQFDDGVEQSDSKAATAALEQMRRIAAVDSRFIVALADCESRLADIKEPEPVPIPSGAGAAATGVSAATMILQAPPAAAPENVVFEKPAPVKTAPAPEAAPVKVAPAARPPAPQKAGVSAVKGALVGVCVALVLLIAGGMVVRARRKSAAPKVEKVVMLPALATAVVSAQSTGLASALSSLGTNIATLQRGQTLNVIALPTSRDQAYTRVQPASGATRDGFVRTADLAQWTGNGPDAAFALLKLFAPGESASEPDVEAQLAKWTAFLGRFPADPHAPEANLESARLELALARLATAAGRPEPDSQAHVDRAREALGRVSGNPAAESEAAELLKGLPAAPSQGETLSPERILRGRVNSLWEAGEYRQAMRLVDQILATSPTHKEALIWKKKIRAAQDAEASAQ